MCLGNGHQQIIYIPQNLALLEYLQVFDDACLAVSVGIT